MKPLSLLCVDEAQHSGLIPPGQLPSIHNISLSLHHHLSIPFSVCVFLPSSPVTLSVPVIVDVMSHAIDTIQSGTNREAWKRAMPYLMSYDPMIRSKPLGSFSDRTGCLCLI